MGTQSLSVTSRNNRSSDPSPESYTASSYATEFAVNETRFDDPVDFIARILESREKELPPAKVKEARAKLKEISGTNDQYEVCTCERVQKILGRLRSLLSGPM